MSSVLRPCAVLAIAALLVGGCATRSGPPQPKGSGNVLLPIEAEYGGKDGPFPRPIRLVIRNQETLLAAKLGQIKVNFDESMVLLAALGKADNDAYGIRITQVREMSDRVIVSTAVEMPTTEQCGTPGTCFPWTAVVVPRSDKPVDRFENNAALIVRRGYNPFR